MPKISVIIPLYNKEPIIERSLRSVLYQDYNDFEVIVVNDGSTDKSADIVRSINDSRIRLIEQENGGPSKARNTGVQHTKGEWIVFLDADDELLPDALYNMYNAINYCTDADLVDFNRVFFDGKNKREGYHPVDGIVNNALLAWYYGAIGPGCGHTIYKSEFIKKYPYNENLRRYEDGELLLRILPVAKVYSSLITTELHNTSCAEASHPRRDISQDLVGHLTINKGSFLGRLINYKFFIEERNNYPTDCRKLYKSWYYRYDLFVLYKLMPYFKSLFL